MVQRAKRSPQYCLGPMWTLYSSFRATLDTCTAGIRSLRRPERGQDDDCKALFGGLL
eukprot:COSAG02_NODE_651_length_18910_cov_12.561639_13_plen_57_part_00